MDCIRQVFTRWLETPKDISPIYSVSWEGLYELLDDAELTDVVTSLKEAIQNAQCELIHCIVCFSHVLPSFIQRSQAPSVFHVTIKN